MKDLFISLGIGAAAGVLALAAMLASDESVPAILAIAVGLMGSMAVLLFRLGPGIRHLITGMERDRVEIAKATEQLRRLVSRIREPSDLQIEMYGGSQPMVRQFEDREKRSRLRKEP